MPAMSHDNSRVPPTTDNTPPSAGEPASRRKLTDSIPGDIKSVRLLWIEAILFVVLGVMAGGIIWLNEPRLQTCLLLLVCVWSMCRAYYFAFHGLQSYADQSFRYAGIWSILRYLLSSRRS